MQRIIYCICLFVTIVISACTPLTLKEAKNVELNSDSLYIAGAVETLKPWRVVRANDYAKANYYYGRQLRAAGSYPEAMKCFLQIIHSLTRDYELKGRAYTNIAIICRLEGNHVLAYDMFQQSADCFNALGDTIAYYYALNSMAFELAEQSEKEKVLDILCKIRKECFNDDVIVRTLETQAEAFFMVQQYDSAILYADMLQKYGNNEPTGQLIKAQSYYFLNNKDSAVYYAKRVVQNSQSWFDLNNAYYILANNDDEAEFSTIQKLHASRSDIQKQIELRQALLSHAVEILMQDLKEEPKYMWIIWFLSFCLIMGIPLYLFLRKHRLTQSLQSMRVENQRQYLLNTCALMQQSTNIMSDLCWNNYDKMCEIVNQNFMMLANKLKAKQVLNEKEIRLCVLVLIGNFSSKQMADILCYGEKSIRSIKRNTAVKLDTNSSNLRDFLLQMAADEANFIE